MALFDLKDNRLEPAVLGRRATDADRSAVLAAVRRQITEVLRRPLLAIGWDQVVGGDALTALDAAGQVVTIEVIDALDSTALLLAMARATGAARSGRDQLASRYPGGLPAFERDLAAFRGSMPTGVEPGPRLTLLATEIADDVRPALGMIVGSGVELHELRVRSTEDGRALVDVEPLRTGVVDHAPDLNWRTAAPGAQTPETPLPEDATVPTPVVAQPSEPESGPQEDAPAAPSPAGAGNGHRLEAAALGAEPTIPSGQASEEALATIAQTIETPATLVWLRRRRGIDHRATLAADGTITIADGTSFRDPSAAANAAQNTQDIDGWRVWRVGVGGPSLRELLA
ncbi:hypothetical protein [Actinomyces ruminicola]|uniref:restriction system modified-DNA reader domain-containing protein n=1 Tax=Actinomyces ruminicola TaxID=332524 RepID=UPI0011C7E1E6|nr:hypothetical protein [Actinomyces ruminicola]